ncbi:MAG: Gfo/Idh/MocA family oxidoreductase [Planctomycetes bacterium]|nr:Gfo/Idh/MocA family oxidoreductase [Planctomycetota bacterium]
MENKYGVLIHGAGWVSTQHLAAFQRHPRSRVVAISSRRLASARKRAEEAGLERVGLYDDLDKALRHEGVDIVSICTPQHVHCENVLAAAAAGKHLVIEKPIGNSLEELRAMQAAVRRAGVKTIVSFVLRWNPLFRTLKRMMRDNAIGDPYYVEADYLHNIGSWWGGFEDGRKKSTGVSAFLLGGCHAIDALRWFACREEFKAAEPVEVFAAAGGYRKGSGRQYDYHTGAWLDGQPPLEYDGLEVALVKFAGGALGKVSVNFDCVMPYKFPVRIFGNLGTIRDNKVWSHKFPEQKGWIKIPSILPDSAEVAHHPFQAQMDSFIECLDRGVESQCNLEDAVKTHEVALAALRCYETRQPVKLPLV